MMGYHDTSDEERRRWQVPERILAEIGLSGGMTFADIGCGRGFFAIPAARIVGGGGAVIAADVDSESLAMLREKAEAEGLGNIRTVAGSAEDTVVCEGCADVAFFGQCLHDFEDPVAAVVRAAKSLKPSGVLANLDWKKERAEKGPPYEKRFSQETASEMMREGGLDVVCVSDSGPYHYLMTAKPKPGDNPVTSR
jgi:ubiquinone/menaquinone biosynthesis C-methylase UbiE